MDEINTIKYNFESKDLDGMMKELLQCHNMTQEEWISIKNKLNGRLKDVEKEIHALIEELKEEKEIAKTKLKIHDEILQDHEQRLRAKKKLLEEEAEDIKALHAKLEQLEYRQTQHHEDLLTKVDNKFTDARTERREENKNTLTIIIASIGISMGVIGGIIIFILEKMI